MLAARAMIERGWIGEVTTISFEVNIDTDFASWGWLGEAPKLEIYFHSIHYIDTIRAFLGEPDRRVRHPVAAARPEAGG